MNASTKTPLVRALLRLNLNSTTSVLLEYRLKLAVQISKIVRKRILCEVDTACAMSLTSRPSQQFIHVTENCFDSSAAGGGGAGRTCENLYQADRNSSE